MKTDRKLSKFSHNPASSRKVFLKQSSFLIASLPILSGLLTPPPAQASYSTYMRSQAEWNERTENGKRPLTSQEELVEAA